jgi:hypothetical protein
MPAQLDRLVVAASIAAVCIASSAPALADMSKEQCLEAHSRGQDAKEQNKLSLARKLFLTCAQSSCPTVVQGDCARFADDLSRLQPSVTFIARDGNGSDLPDTTVYVDGELIVTHLDGAQHDVDPGSHVVKFQSGGKEQTVTVVIGGGEKGRAVTATFGSPSESGAQAAKGDNAALVKRGPRVTHARGSKLLLWSGVALVATGASFGVLGVIEMPSNCSLSSHQCAAPPGDPAFKKASSAATMTDIGWTTGILGLAALGGGVLWYMSSAHSEKQPRDHMAIAPWWSPTGGGFALTGEL